MAGRIRAHDWAATPLGPIESWPQGLRTAVRLMLATRRPAFLFWGAELRCLYNDAHAACLGPEKHPAILGAPGPDAWAGSWPVFGPEVEKVKAGGEPAWHEDRPVPIVRHGRREDAWWTYSLSPIDDEASPSGVGGVLAFSTGTTGRALAGHGAEERPRAGEARYRTLFDSIDEGFCVLQLIFDEERKPVDYRYVETNPAFERQAGMKGALGKTVRELVPGIEPFWFDLYGKVALTGEPARFVDRAEPMGRWFDVHAVRIGEPRDRTVAVLFSDITARKRTEEALRESEARFRTLAEAIGDVFYITDLDRDALLYLSPAYERVWGRPAAELRADISAFLDTVHPDDRPALLAGKEAQRRGEPVSVEYRVFRPDGELRWIFDRSFPAPDALGRRAAGIASDVTGRKRAEAALRESEARFRHMADSAPGLIWMTDADGRLVFANMHHDHVFGRPAAEMLEDGWAKMLLPEDLGPFSAAFQAAFRDRRPFRAEARVRDRTGRVRWLRCEGVPRLDDAGAFLGYTGCNVDITEARLAAEELERRVAARTSELMAAEESLRQAQKMEAVGQLTGGIAHDFNNMLQGVAGAVEMARRRVAEGRAAEAGRYLDAARAAADRAAGLTRRLLAFARRQRLDPKPVDPDRLVAGMADLVRRTVGVGAELELRLREDAWSVLCDANELESALLNLCINARDAMPGGGRLMIGTEDVRLSAADVAGQEGAAPGDYVAISVSDTGTGIPPEVLERVFEPFFTTKPVGQGTGLGLSQIYGFARQSGGFVRLESELGRGTTVTLFLPRHGPAEAAAPEAGRPAAAEEPAGAAGATVLLVDDEAAVRGPAAERLRDLGHSVLEAADGPAALRLLGGGARIDLLVTDVGLPRGMNGRQVAEAVRERAPGVPVLFITGYAANTRLPPGTEVIGKPFGLDALARRVQALLAAEGRGGPAGAAAGGPRAPERPAGRSSLAPQDAEDA